MQFKEKMNKNGKWLYIGLWVFAIFIIYKISSINQRGVNYIGLAESEEISVSSKRAVSVKKIHVISGQKIEKGMLLLELARPDLESKLNELSHSLRELEAKSNLNKNLTNSLKTIKYGQAGEDSPIDIQIESLKEKIKYLKREEEELLYFSKTSRIIGSVNYKEGEQISPFSPIITLHNSKPSMVKGYIHESVHNKAHSGQLVSISSFADKNKSTLAKVINVGTRIVELPPRFNRTAASKTYGREVIIKIPKNNPFLLGEKVFIEPRDEGNAFFDIEANAKDDVEKPLAHDEGKELTYLLGNSLKPSFLEPSGLIYLKSIERYVLISDDTNKVNEPILYLLNKEAKKIVGKSTIDGLKSMGDMESIAKIDEKSFLILSSLSKKKNSYKVPKNRRYLVKVTSEAGRFTLERKVNLYKLLQGALNKKTPYYKNSFFKKKRLNIEIEGMAIRNKSLLLALKDYKASKKNKQLIILEIQNFNEVLQNNQIKPTDVSVFSALSYPRNTKEGYTDLINVKGELYALTAINGRANIKSRLLLITKDSLKELLTITEGRAEGIVYNKEEREFIVAFDKGKETKPILKKIRIDDL